MALVLDGNGTMTVGNGDITGLVAGALPSTVIGAGAVLQVVSANLASFFSTTSTIPLDDTIPQITEGAEILTCAITPTSATSKLYITAVFNTTASIVALSTIALFQDSTVNALVSSWGTTSAGNSPPPAMTINYSMTSGTTSSTTFRVRGGMNSAGTFQINGGSGARYLGGSLISSITITEIAS